MYVKRQKKHDKISIVNIVAKLNSATLYYVLIIDLIVLALVYMFICYLDFKFSK